MTHNNSVTAECSATHQCSFVTRLICECVASLLLMFAIYMFSTVALAMYGINIVLVALGTALAYATVLIFAAHICAAHLNPAITVASMLTGRTPLLKGFAYIIAQALGAIIAAGLVAFILPKSKMLPGSTWYVPAVNGFDAASVSANQLNSVNTSFNVIAALIVEVIAAIIIVSVALSKTDDQGQPRCGYAVSTAIAYALGALITYPITGASLNPARSTGIALVASMQKMTVNPLTQLWVFWIAPLFASALVGFCILLVKLYKAPAVARQELNQVDNTEEADDIIEDDTKKEGPQTLVALTGDGEEPTLQ